MELAKRSTVTVAEQPGTVEDKHTLLEPLTTVLSNPSEWVREVLLSYRVTPIQLPSHWAMKSETQPDWGCVEIGSGARIRT